MLAYFDISTPAPVRLAAMRAVAGPSRTWRDARHWTLANYQAAHCTMHGTAGGEHYTHTGPYFPGREKWADDVAPRAIAHRGWFTDGEQQDTARGFVVQLPHGRYMAGFYWSSNGERVYLPGAYDCERTAAYAADSAAERFAEAQSADSERFDAMTKAESHAESVTDDVRHAWEVRHASDYWREHCRNCIAELRAARANLQRATDAYNRGEA